MQQPKVGTNNAIRTLLDEPQMIGRHRGIVADWFQTWVDEHIATETVEDGVSLTEVVERLRKKLISQIASAPFAVTEEKVAMVPGWRHGQPVPKGTPMGKRVTLKFFSFRQSKRTDEGPGAA